MGTDDLTRTGTVMGTARYLAPEQVNGHVTDARTDVYGLGLVLFEMLCGHPPFGGDTEIATAMARLTTAAPSIRAERPEVSAELDDLVHKCLAPPTRARFASAGAASLALERMRTPGQHPSTRAEPAREARAAARARAVTTPAPAAAEPRGQAPAAAAKPAATPARSRRRGSKGWLWVVLALVIVLGAGRRGGLPRPGRHPVRRLELRGDARPAGGALTIAGRLGIRSTPGRRPRGRRRARQNVIDRRRRRRGPPSSTDSRSPRRKPGVGLRLRLAREATLTSVTVKTTSGGWSGEIYVAQAAGRSSPTGGTRSRRAATSGPTTPSTSTASAGSYVLVWLTALPARADNGYQLEISEITVA